MVFDAAASLLMRLTLLHELVSEERRREWSGLVATGNMRIAGGTGVGRLDAQHKVGGGCGKQRAVPAGTCAPPGEPERIQQKNGAQAVMSIPSCG